MKPVGVINHQVYSEACADLIYEMGTFRPGDLIAIIGPSGVGKTTLRHACMREFFGHPRSWGLGRMPVVEIYPRLAAGGYFSSKDFAGMFQDELHVPRLKWLDLGADEWIMGFNETIHSMKTEWARLKNRQATEGQCWDSIDLSLAARGCLYVSIEQVTTLMVTRQTRELSEHVLNLLNIAERCKIMIIVTGVTKALGMWHKFHELGRRVHPVWVRNYNWQHSGDERAFLRLLKALSVSFKTYPASLMSTMAAEILIASGGTVGGVTKLLGHAAKVANIRGGDGISKQDIEASYPSAGDIDRIWEHNDEFKRAAAPAKMGKRLDKARSAWMSQRG